MDLPITIEPMRDEDLETVAAIEKASFKDPWPLQAFRTELEYNRLSFYLVARYKGRIIAYIGAWIILDETHITTLAVDEPYRRRGIATRLLEALIDEARRQAAHCVTLEVRPTNAAARRFYEKYGFSIQGRRKAYYADEDALIMTKNDLLMPGKKEGGGTGEEQRS